MQSRLSNAKSGRRHYSLIVASRLCLPVQKLLTAELAQEVDRERRVYTRIAFYQSNERRISRYDCKSFPSRLRAISPSPDLYNISAPQSSSFLDEGASHRYDARTGPANF